MLKTVTSADGTPIACESGGSGPPLVFVNGALSDRRSARLLRPLLEPSFTVIGFDRRGRGDSGDASTYAPEREVEDLAAVCADLGAPPFVFGRSSGAVLAVEGALHGLPIAALAIYESPYTIPGTRHPLRHDLAEDLDRRLADGNRGAAVRLFLDEAIQLPEPVVDDLESSPGWPPLLAMAHTLPYDTRLVGSGAIPVMRLAQLDLPCLVIAGGASPAWMRDGVEALAQAIPGSRHVVLPGQTHQAAPEVIAEQLVGFFAPMAVSAR
jgi:pimeloyl-ACP methyl ester carboxylesterase